MNKNIKLVTKHIVAEMLSVSTRTVFKLRKQGILKSYLIFNEYKYNLSDVNKYINNCKVD